MTEKSTNYKELSAELDEILDKLQSSDIDVDDAIGLYDRGIKIAKKLEKYLKEATNRVEKIKKTWETKEG